MAKGSYFRSDDDYKMTYIYSYNNYVRNGYTVNAQPRVLHENRIKRFDLIIDTQSRECILQAFYITIALKYVCIIMIMIA